MSPCVGLLPRFAKPVIELIRTSFDGAVISWLLDAIVPSEFKEVEEDDDGDDDDDDDVNDDEINFVEYKDGINSRIAMHITIRAIHLISSLFDQAGK